ncbi:hypothetical protein ACH473_10705 [Cellulosimicrobium funkei]|uniref:Gp37-like protein n=1 Tax=Cellulosimicrobium funkei TaxID=264251 RepID=UPI0037B4FD8D
MTTTLEGAPPITLTAYTGTFVRRGDIAAPNEVNILGRHNAPGAVVFQLDDDHERVADLTDEGARVVCTYRPPVGGDPYTISGTVWELDGTDDAAGTRSFMVLDDFDAVFNAVQGWPNPTGTIDQQGDEGAYHTVTGPAETVLKAITTPNASRQGVPLTVPPTQGRGASITVSIRMHPLGDRLFPAVDLAGIGARVVQAGAGLELQTYEPATYTRELTQDSGAILSGTYKRTPPTVTRVVVGAGGEGTARRFLQVIDHDAEALWKIRRAAFVDARDIPGDDPNLTARMTERAHQALAEGAARTGLKVELAETDAFGFMRTFRLGDQVPVRLRGAPRLTDRVREVEILWTPDDGLEVTPRIGEWQDSESDEMYRLISAALTATRDLETR